MKYTLEEDKIILKFRTANYTWKDIGNLVNRSENAVRKRYNRLIDTANARMRADKFTNVEEHILFLLNKNKSMSIEELMDILKFDNIEQLLVILYKLMSDSYDIIINSNWVIYEPSNHLNTFEFIRGAIGKIKVALTGDWHIGSKCQQITRLQEFIDEAYSRGIRDVICSGDVFDGTRVFRDHTEEIFLHTIDEQVDYATEVIPKYEGLHYYLISGNHDHGFGTGMNAVSTLASRRDDITYLGKYGAYLDLNGITIYLHHGLGSQTYALSYKLQKFVEQLPAGYMPDIVAQAHYHYLFYAPIRGVYSFELGSFQGLTSFAKRMGKVYSHIGGWFYEMEKTEHKILTNPVDTSYEEINHDYPYMKQGDKTFIF